MRNARQHTTRIASALALMIFGALGPAAAQQLGEITGHVVVTRKKLFAKPERVADVRDVVVYVTGFASPTLEQPLATLDQQGEQFAPRLLPVVAGQEVSFPNRDRIYHNVFSVSPVKSFDLGQYKSSDAPRRARFERAGLVPVYCNIHPHMIAYVVVLENAAYALAKPDGAFTIRGVPVGRHVIHAWTPGAEAAHREIEVAPGAPVRVDFELIAGAIPGHKRKDGTEYPRPGSELER
jgi:plastocyanin